MGRVDRVHEIWRESRCILGLVDGLYVEGLSNVKFLNDRADHALVRNVFVRLGAGQTQGRDPLDRLASSSDDFSTLSEPVFNLICV